MTILQDIIDSFKPPIEGKGAAIEMQESRGSTSYHASESGRELKRNLKGRHLQMIAIGGSIGTGLFIASGTFEISRDVISYFILFFFCYLGFFLFFLIVSFIIVIISYYFIPIGGSFVVGGPASVLIAFLLVGSMLFAVVQALGELAVLFPIQGSFNVYGTRFLDPAWGYES
jgi:yeast amino acid transporter